MELQKTLPRYDHDKDKETYQLDVEFLEQLSSFPQAVQHQFQELSNSIKMQLFKEGKQKSKTKNELYSFATVRRGTIDDLEEMAQEDRHMRGVYDAVEIREMDSIDRELLTNELLGKFFRIAATEKLLFDHPEKIKQVFDILWANRLGEKGALVVENQAHYDEVRQQLNVLLTEKKQLKAQIEKLLAKKSLNRNEQKTLKTLNHELAEKFGESFFMKTLSPTGSVGSNGETIMQLKAELKKAEKLLNLESTLALCLQYYDAATTAIIFSEVLERRAKPYGNPVQIRSVVDDLAGQWSVEHDGEGAIEQSPAANPAAEKRFEKLRDHFWRLFHSYQRLRQDKATSEAGLSGKENLRVNQSQLEMTSSDLQVVIGMLEKYS